MSWHPTEVPQEQKRVLFFDWAIRLGTGSADNRGHRCCTDENAHSRMHRKPPNLRLADGEAGKITWHKKLFIRSGSRCTAFNLIHAQQCAMPMHCWPPARLGSARLGSTSRLSLGEEVVVVTRLVRRGPGQLTTDATRLISLVASSRWSADHSMAAKRCRDGNELI
ncbi:unnamed protein product [Soboliphyme baturini]|uniref:Uncharacterized protein n=1 Tax=Soboliphyme baturini TaxID=241478 RepID=A0A183IJ11_9BILA|nr:unnamed protein product [Soboliphyme baturini]